ncbi:hypothetical protein TNIN_379411 [Trichonephila inaurata madagascariensis]|uniref:Uncharacterized protein n=1 Tax=Trichonephila inaurata madagascariensis TaxID=2747483 RepID=A0A8X6XH56_9ARAC|nr:hypothetical protein TNIN_379411 [Trichonephila inaurata madagascariensis]
MNLERVLMEVAGIVMCIFYAKFLSETYSVLYRKNHVASLASSARIICRNARLSLLVIVIIGSRNIINATMASGKRFVPREEHCLKIDGQESEKMHQKLYAT